MSLEPTCLIDGYPLDGYGYSPPSHKKPNGKFGFDDVVFYSPGAALYWLMAVQHASPHRVWWLQLHVRDELGIKEPVELCPDPRLLAKNRRDRKGLTKEMFRANNRRLVERINHLPIDLRVWITEPQVDHPEPFYETIDGQINIAQMLLASHLEQGKPVAKVLLQDAAVAAAAAAAIKADTPSTTSVLALTLEEQKRDGTPIASSDLQDLELHYGGSVVVDSDDEQYNTPIATDVSSPHHQQEEEEHKTEHPQPPLTRTPPKKYQIQTLLTTTGSIDYRQPLAQQAAARKRKAA